MLKRLSALGAATLFLSLAPPAAADDVCTAGPVGRLTWSGYSPAQLPGNPPPWTRHGGDTNNRPTIVATIGEQWVIISLQTADSRQLVEMGKMRAQLLAAMLAGVDVEVRSNHSDWWGPHPCQSPDGVYVLQVEQTLVRLATPR